MKKRDFLFIGIGLVVGIAGTWAHHKWIKKAPITPPAKQKNIKQITMRIMKINRKNKGNKKSKPPKYTTENGNDKRNFTKKKKIKRYRDYDEEYD